MSHKDIILKFALQNAAKFDGKANTGAVIGKVIGEHPELKEDMKSLAKEINAVIKEISKLSVAEQLHKLKEIAPELLEKKKEEEKKELPPLPNAVEGKVITRLAPEPSKYNHLGHAVSFLLNYIYSKRYNGKCLLRFEDTNPEKVSQEYVDAMKEDVLDYLGIKVDSTRFISDDMPVLYDYAEKLIKMDKAYMCFCPREQLQDLRHKGEECKCRKQTVKKNSEEWKKLMDGKYMEGEAVLRIKGDMKSLNHVMRDPVIFRAVKEKHYRYGDKYKVWPMYDLYNPIEDSLMGVTHILRSNEFDMRVELQDYIKDLLKLNKQTIVQYGRFNVIGAVTQGREIRALIESGEYLGWDDPRLVTLRALKRRGITKEVFYEMVNQVGLSKYQVNLGFEMIAAISRKLLDKEAERYSFIPDPVKLEIKNMPDLKEVEIKIHPDKEETKKVKIKEVYISKEDYHNFVNKEVRLMHLFNLKISKGHKAEFIGLENSSMSKINWVSDPVEAKILMPDAKWTTGYAEKAAESLKPGSIIQFERFGFCRLDKKGKTRLEFWFGHK